MGCQLGDDRRLAEEHKQADMLEVGLEDELHTEPMRLAVGEQCIALRNHTEPRAGLAAAVAVAIAGSFAIVAFFCGSSS